MLKGQGFPMDEITSAAHGVEDAGLHDALHDAFRKAAGPVLLIRPGTDTLDRVLAAKAACSGDGGEAGASFREILCVHDDFPALERLWRRIAPQDGDGSFIAYHGTVADVVRDFPLAWQLVCLEGGKPGHAAGELRDLAHQITADSRVVWRDDGEARGGTAAALVSAGVYARADGGGTALSFHPAPGAALPDGGPVEQWGILRALLHERYFAQEHPEPGRRIPVGDVLRSIRRSWLKRGTEKLGTGKLGDRSGWPYAAPDAPPLPPTLPDGRPWPRISIVTPSYNQGHYIEETLLSVINQNYPNVEHIVMDGGSTDATMEVVGRYRDRLAQAVSEKDRGQSHAINKGMALATGDILTWLNSDDMLAPGALAAVAMAFATAPADLVAGICCLYRGGELVGKHLTACEDGPLPIDDILDLDHGWNAGQFFYQPEVFYSRDLWERAGGRVNEALYYSMDYELWLRFAEQGGRLHVISRPLAWFRLHDEQKTAAEQRFKTELLEFRDRYLERTGRSLSGGRAFPDFSRRLRVLLLNDNGGKYGAGIAHARMMEALRRAGQEVEAIALALNGVPPGQPCPVSSDELLAQIETVAPDLIVVGNLHSARINPIVFGEVSRRWPTLIVLHDLWWLTGRCAYTRGCDALLTGCGADCPTPAEYPDLAPELIADAWRDKRRVLTSGHAPMLLANSAWTKEQAHRAFPEGQAPAIERMTLGFPLEIFRPRDRKTCRDLLGLPRDRFIVLFSASSILDTRKGGDLLVDVARSLDMPDILFAATGHGTAQQLGVPEDRFRALGYVEDPERLAIIYAAADIVVAPSTEETFGQIFVEAIACGTPVVGHGLTGVADAIRDGVTGLVTAAPTAADLEAAILALYRQPWLRRSLARWGRIHAENIWSLEACYRSLFIAFRRLGLVDRLGLPHKIGFIPGQPAAAAFDEPERRGRSWVPGTGVCPEEGPYPEHDLPARFHWVCGPKSRVELLCRESGPHFVAIDYQNPLFEGLPLTIEIDGVEVRRVRLPKTAGGASSLLHFKADLATGARSMTLTFGRWQEPGAAERRALAMIIRRIHVIPLA